MKVLRYVFGSDDRVQAVLRSALQRLLEGFATAITATVLLVTGAGLSFEWAAGCFALITTLPAILRIVAEGIPKEQRV